MCVSPLPGAIATGSQGAAWLASCRCTCSGQPMAIEALVEIAGRYALPVVEDAAESLGSFVAIGSTARGRSVRWGFQLQWQQDRDNGRWRCHRHRRSCAGASTKKPDDNREAPSSVGVCCTTKLPNTACRISTRRGCAQLGSSRHSYGKRLLASAQNGLAIRRLHIRNRRKATAG